MFTNHGLIFQLEMCLQVAAGNTEYTDKNTAAVSGALSILCFLSWKRLSKHLLFKYAGKINSNNSATLLVKFASEK